jgi:hypothetical protein
MRDNAIYVSVDVIIEDGQYSWMHGEKTDVMCEETSDRALREQLELIKYSSTSVAYRRSLGLWQGAREMACGVSNHYFQMEGMMQ